LLLNAGASPRNLQVEATESGLLHGPQSGNVPTGVRALGIGLAIDDFGTGYSSLARLQTLGPDVLKIDKSFVDAIGTETPMSQLVPHMIDMGRSLHLKIVAEGVEREEQAEYLRRRGVQYGQGWLFGRSMGLERFRAALAAQVIDAPAVVRVPESRS
jgi:sensor c-di-GMP phosphodiesterase-like protein